MPAPLAARWVDRRLPELRAGALAVAHVEVENAGTTAWRDGRCTASYHWLDDRGNAIVWDGLRTPVAAEPGATAAVELAIRAPIPPGRYRLSIDLVDEGRFWFGEVGSETLDADVDVLPRVETLAETEARLGPALADERWAEVVLAAHREGYAVVGGAVDGAGGRLRRGPRELAPYAPGAGRVPGFAHPLVCPSVIRGVEVEWTEVAGLPAAIPPPGEPSLYDGRAVVSLRRR
jgi:hypothetical protein